MSNTKRLISLDLNDIKQSGLFDCKQLATIINKNTILEGRNVVKTIVLTKVSDSEFDEIHNLKGYINFTWRNTVKNSDVEMILKKMSEMENRITLNVKKEIKKSEKRVKTYVDKKVNKCETNVKTYVDKKIEETKDYVDKKFDEHVKNYH